MQVFRRDGSCLMRSLQETAFANNFWRTIGQEGATVQASIPDTPRTTMCRNLETRKNTHNNQARLEQVFRPSPLARRGDRM